MEKDDAHFCLRCRSTIIGLDEYVTHRKADSCRQEIQTPEPALFVPHNQDDAEVLSQPGHERLLPSSHFSTTAADALASEAAFMESIGLYLNPKPSLQLTRVAGLMSPRSSGVKTDVSSGLALQEEREAATRDDWEDGLILTKSKTSFSSSSPLQDIETGGTNSKSDFLRQMDLMTVDQHQAGGPGAARWKLWHPEQEVTGEDLWSDMLSATEGDLYLDTVANDPTLMEMSVTMASITQAAAVITPGQLTPTSQNTFKSKGKWLAPSEEISLPHLADCQTDTAEKSPHHCTTCSRSLSSLDALSRHLSSELHFKRSASILAISNVAVTPRKRIKLLPERIKEAELPEEPAVIVCQPELQALSNPVPPPVTSSSGKIIRCETCQSSVKRNQFGKHLISHYHHHKSMGHPGNTQLALDYIEDIVMEAPYKCRICKFYCNWSHEFVSHWTGDHHRQHDNQESNEVYWCSFCRFQSFSSAEMLVHLKSEDHCEISDVINRSVPIIIRKFEAQTCSICSRSFRLKFTLRAHMKKAHKQKNFSLPDHERYECLFCPSFKTCSKKSITSHQFLAHPEQKPRQAYECRFCFIYFKSKMEAERHRKSLGHRTQVKQSRGHSTEVTCQFCPQKLESLSMLKDHIWNEHKEETSQCGLCGESFALPQELSVHVRAKCQQHSGGRHLDESRSRSKCLNCQFSCISQAMMLLHKSLKHITSSNQSRMTCIVCSKSCSNRSKLLEHIRTHLKDEMFKCKVCFKLFATLSSLQSHLDKVHDSSKTRPDSAMESSVSFCDQKLSLNQGLFQNKKHRQHSLDKSVKSYLCSDCNFVTEKRSSLKSHRLVHIQDKQLTCEHCSYFSCKRSSELKRHLRLKHGNFENDKQKPVLKCCQCNYETVFKQHLQRHKSSMHLMLSEKWAMLFYCPGCDYSCGAMDNLRKHILSTKKHTGMKIYTCRTSSCNFATNESQDFKRHLLSGHEDKFPNTRFVKQYMEDFFKKKSQTSEEKQPRRKQLLHNRTCNL